MGTRQVEGGGGGGTNAEPPPHPVGCAKNRHLKAETFLGQGSLAMLGFPRRDAKRPKQQPKRRWAFLSDTLPFLAPLPFGPLLLILAPVGNRLSRSVSQALHLKNLCTSQELEPRLGIVSQERFLGKFEMFGRNWWTCLRL